MTLPAPSLEATPNTPHQTRTDTALPLVSRLNPQTMQVSHTGEVSVPDSSVMTEQLPPRGYQFRGLLGSCSHMYMQSHGVKELQGHRHGQQFSSKACLSSPHCIGDGSDLPCGQLPAGDQPAQGRDTLGRGAREGLSFGLHCLGQHALRMWALSCTLV
jgi:hypothetical protein